VDGAVVVWWLLGLWCDGDGAFEGEGAAGGDVSLVEVVGVESFGAEAAAVWWLWGGDGLSVGWVGVEFEAYGGCAAAGFDDEFVGVVDEPADGACHR